MSSNKNNKTSPITDAAINFLDQLNEFYTSYTTEETFNQMNEAFLFESKNIDGNNHSLDTENDCSNRDNKIEDLTFDRSCFISKMISPIKELDSQYNNINLPCSYVQRGPLHYIFTIYNVIQKVEENINFNILLYQNKELKIIGPLEDLWLNIKDVYNILDYDTTLLKQDYLLIKNNNQKLLKDVLQTIKFNKVLIQVLDLNDVYINIFGLLEIILDYKNIFVQTKYKRAQSFLQYNLSSLIKKSICDYLYEINFLINFKIDVTHAHLQNEFKKYITNKINLYNPRSNKTAGQI